jgi:hypothetical protein
MHCAKCKLAVVELPNKEIVKACQCDAPIVAEMEATVKQTSKLE